MTRELGRWDPLPLDELVAVMDAFPARWWISGGVALELHLGRQWRDHADVDVGICRRDAGQLAATLAGWEIAVASGGVLTPWDGTPPPASSAQNNLWCGRDGGPWRIDVVLGDGDDDRWVYRRDPTFTLPWHRAVLTTVDGVPYLAPALQLLFKRTSIRPKDQVDADVVFAELDPTSIALLDLHLPPDHPWRHRADR